MRAILFVAVPLVGAVVYLSAQTPATFRGGVHTVQVYATVRDREGQLVRDLTRDDFELLENGKRRTISVFSNERQPISVAILLDRSGSIGSAAPQVSAAALAFVSKLLDGDRAAVNLLTWDCQAFTADKARLREVLGGRLQGDLGSPVWAGLDRTLSAISLEASRRVVLMLSDGADSGSAMLAMPDRNGDSLLRIPGICRRQSVVSRATAADVARRAAREDVMVYAVGVETAGPTRDNDLRRIAQDSGGEFIWLKRGADLTDTFTRIADELHHQYLIGFVPESFDGKVHRIEVRATRPRVTVRARRSFVADRDTRPGAGGSASVTPVAPLAPATAAEVDQAIADGRAGKRLQASCLANGAFPDKPAEREFSAEVLFEGPLGRIMRRSREAARDGTPFDASRVTETDRAPRLTVTAVLKSALAADPFGPPPAETPPPRPTAMPMSNLRLWSGGPSPTSIPAIDMSTGGGLLHLVASQRMTVTFDLAEFKAMPGARLEAVVYSLAGERSCHINEKDKLALR